MPRGGDPAAAAVHLLRPLDPGVHDDNRGPSLVPRRDKGTCRPPPRLPNTISSGRCLLDFSTSPSDLGYLVAQSCIDRLRFWLQSTALRFDILQSPASSSCLPLFAYKEPLSYLSQNVPLFWAIRGFSLCVRTSPIQDLAVAISSPKKTTAFLFSLPRLQTVCQGYPQSPSQPFQGPPCSL